MTAPPTTSLKKQIPSSGVDFVYGLDGSEVGDRYIPTKVFENNTLEMVAKKSMSVFLPKIQAEMERISIVNKELPENSYYNNLKREEDDGSITKLGENFTMFDGVLQDSTKKILYSLINKNEIDLTKLSKENLEKIETDINNYFKGQIATVTEKLNNSYSVDNLSKTSRENLISSFVYNSWIQLTNATFSSLVNC